MCRETLRKCYVMLLSVLIAAALYAIINQLDNRRYIAVYAESTGQISPLFILDPGHGGEDGGAVSPDGLVESGINLDIALRLRELCGFFGIRSIMTRETEELDYPADLSRTAERKRWDTRRRTELINSQQNAVLLSIAGSRIQQNVELEPHTRYTLTFKIRLHIADRLTTSGPLLFGAWDPEKLKNTEMIESGGQPTCRLNEQSICMLDPAALSEGVQEIRMLDVILV